MSKQPLVRVFILMVIGILLNELLKVAFLFLLIFAAFALLNLLVISKLQTKLSYKFRYQIGTLINVQLILIGMLVSSSHTSQNVLCRNRANIDFNSYNNFIGECISTRKSVSKWNSSTFRIKSIHKNDEWRKASSLLNVIYSELGDEIEVGDLVAFKGKADRIEKPLNPGEFDFSSYQAATGIYYSIFLDSLSFLKIGQSEEMNLFLFAKKIRNKLEKKIERFELTKENRSFINALILGDRSMLSIEQKNDFKDAGVMHVMAVSGLHVGTLYLLLNLLLYWLNSNVIGKILKLAVILVSLWTYCLITGLSTSVIRASLMLSFLATGELIESRTKSFNLIAASAIIILLLDSNSLFMPGFQLSYLAVTGIILFTPILYKTLAFKSGIINKIWNLTCVSIAAQIITMPVSIYYFHQFPTYFLPANLIVIPLITILFYLGLVFIGLLWIETIATLIATLLNWIIDFLEKYVAFINELPMAVVDSVHFSLIVCMLLYSLILVIYLEIHFKRIRILAIALILSVLLLFVRIDWQMEVLSNKQLIFYSIKGSTAFDLINGRRNILFGDSLFIHDTSDQQRILKPYYIEKGIVETKKVILSDEVNQDTSILYLRNNRKYMLLNAFDKLILVLRDKVNSIVFPSTNINYMLISNQSISPENYLSSNITADTIILDGTNYDQFSKMWSAYCDTTDCELIDLKKVGALIVNLKSYSTIW